MKPTSAITYANDATAARKRKPHLKMSESDDEDYFDPPAKKSRKSTASELDSAVGSNSAKPGLVNVKVETDTDTEDAWSEPHGQFPSTQPTWSLFENSEDRKMQQYNTTIKKLEKTYDVYASRKNWGLLLDIHSQIHKEVKLMNREGEGDEEKLMVAPKQKKTVESAYTSLLEKIEELYKLESHLIESLSLKMDEEPSFAEHIMKKLDECIRIDLKKTMSAMAKQSSVTVSEQCNEEGCTNQAQKGGVYIKHGGKLVRKLCSSEGCTNHVVKGGVCVRHGARHKPCSIEGCTNQVIKRGVCVRHGAERKRCSSEGCANQVVKGGVCIKHGAKRKL